MPQTLADGGRKVYHVSHPSFEGRDAEAAYGPDAAAEDDFARAHMPDEVTRDLARRMHYAAWRAGRAGTARGRAAWEAAYLRLRDRVVLGNRKLIYRAVRRWSPPAGLADDLVGDCQVVLIQAVAAYNPWLGVRFSTYAFTCLMRALSRLSQRQAADKLARWLPLEALPDGGPRDGEEEEAPAGRMAQVEEVMRQGLLSAREREVITRRYRLDEAARGGTLEEVGRQMGLSKERVRQVQAAALGKLRQALGGAKSEAGV